MHRAEHSVLGVAYADYTRPPKWRKALAKSQWKEENSPDHHLKDPHFAFQNMSELGLGAWLPWKKE